MMCKKLKISNHTFWPSNSWKFLALGKLTTIPYHLAWLKHCWATNCCCPINWLLCFKVFWKFHLARQVILHFDALNASLLWADVKVSSDVTKKNKSLFFFFWNNFCKCFCTFRYMHALLIFAILVCRSRAKIWNKTNSCNALFLESHGNIVTYITYPLVVVRGQFALVKVWYFSLKCWWLLPQQFKNLILF